MTKDIKDFAGVGYRASLAWTHNCLGDALAQTSRLSDAEAQYRVALAIQHEDRIVGDRLDEEPVAIVAGLGDIEAV